MAGNQTEVVLDKSIDSSSSETTSEFDAEGDQEITLQVDGDGNSDNLDITVQGKVRDVGSDSWTKINNYDSQDLTTTKNNSEGFSDNSKNYSKVRWVIENDGASGSSVKAIASRQD